MDEPTPAQRTGPRFWVLVALLFAVVGWLMMLQVANVVEQGNHHWLSATAGPPDHLNPAYFLTPQIGLVPTFGTLLWSFLPGCRGPLYVLSVGLIVLAVLGIGLGVYLWLWAGQIFSAGW